DRAIHFDGFHMLISQPFFDAAGSLCGAINLYYNPALFCNANVRLNSLLRDVLNQKIDGFFLSIQFKRLDVCKIVRFIFISMMYGAQTFSLTLCKYELVIDNRVLFEKLNSNEETILSIWNILVL